MSIRSTHSRVVIPLENKSKSENMLLHQRSRVTVLKKKKQFKAPGQDGWVGLFEGDRGKAELFELVPPCSLPKPL